MPDTTTPTIDALPFVRNASPLRLKLMAMQPGETRDVAPQELPASYKGIKALLTDIGKKYGIFLGALKLADGSGWRVVRVNTAEEAQNFTPKRKKTKADRLDEPVRLYNMTDADLLELILKKVAIANRDIADLTPWGVTAADLTALNTDVLAFAALPPDIQLQGDEIEAAEIKDAARDTLQTRLGNLRTMAENTFGTTTVEYAVFSFEGMAGETDDRLLRLAKRALRQGTADQAAMVVWGCTPAFLTQLETDIRDFDTKIDDLHTAEAARKKGTVLRIKTGNDLYMRLDKICNTGKDFYRPVSEAKYNDYLIYS